jgi:5'/3'-nucleotidase SurE
MKLSRRFLVFMVLFIAAVIVPSGPALAKQPVPEPLNILLTNDDGYQSPGIQYLRAALLAAGHNVTLVAPLDNQSGTGATVGDAEWVEVLEQSPGVWSVENTPVATVNVALGLIMADNPPDLIISGMNFGQNLGVRGSTGSGTICAAHYGLQKNFPSIAVSVGVLFDEINSTPIPFPSTFEAFPPAADFIVRLVKQLQQTSKDGRIFPPDVMLNINIPIPYSDINGVMFTRLGKLTFVDVMYLDVNGVIPNGGGLVQTALDFPQSPDPVANSDFDAYAEGYISITVMDGDMSTLHPPSIVNKVMNRLSDLSTY